MPELAGKEGHDIVTSSGDTLLGADDKAGVAEIMAAVAHLAAHPELPRPTLRIGFTPDEEIGQGASHFDVERFGAACAYTMDGSTVGELQDETFTGVEALVTIHGVDVHPGFATGKMVNAARLAGRLLAALPPELTPETTSGRQGFIHPYEVSATRRQGRHPPDRARLRRRPARASRRAAARDRRGGRRRRAAGPRSRSTCAASTPTCAATSSPSPRSSRWPSGRSAPRASSRCGTPIRGGTDGSLLSSMGLPTPNVFTGGHEYHSVREWASVQDMAAAAATIVRLAEEWTRR